MDLFVTGTGTDVGKTYFCLLLLRWLQSRECDPIYYKPLATGCSLDFKEGAPSDRDRISSELCIETHVSFSYQEPLAPYAIQEHLDRSGGCGRGCGCH